MASEWTNRESGPEVLDEDQKIYPFQGKKFRKIDLAKESVPVLEHRIEFQGIPGRIQIVTPSDFNPPFSSDGRLLLGAVSAELLPDTKGIGRIAKMPVYLEAFFSIRRQGQLSQLSDFVAIFDFNGTLYHCNTEPDNRLFELTPGSKKAEKLFFDSLCTSDGKLVMDNMPLPYDLDKLSTIGLTLSKKSSQVTG